MQVNQTQASFTNMCIGIQSHHYGGKTAQDDMNHLMEEYCDLNVSLNSIACSYLDLISPAMTATILTRPILNQGHEPVCPYNPYQTLF